MTSYSYQLVLSDGEVMMLEAALGLMLKHCEEGLADGPAAPFIAWRSHTKAVLSRLHDNAQLRSYSTFEKNPPPDGT